MFGQTRKYLLIKATNCRLSHFPYRVTIDIYTGESLTRDVDPAQLVDLDGTTYLKCTYCSDFLTNTIMCSYFNVLTPQNLFVYKRILGDYCVWTDT